MHGELGRRNFQSAQLLPWNATDSLKACQERRSHHYCGAERKNDLLGALNRRSDLMLVDIPGSKSFSTAKRLYLHSDKIWETASVRHHGQKPQKYFKTYLMLESFWSWVTLGWYSWLSHLSKQRTCFPGVAEPISGSLPACNKIE